MMAIVCYKKVNASVLNKTALETGEESNVIIYSSKLLITDVCSTGESIALKLVKYHIGYLGNTHCKADLKQQLLYVARVSD